MEKPFFDLVRNCAGIATIFGNELLAAAMWVRFNTNFDTLGAFRLSLPLIIAPLLLLFWFRRGGIPWPQVEGPTPARLLRRQLGSRWFHICRACALLLGGLSVGLP